MKNNLQTMPKCLSCQFLEKDDQGPIGCNNANDVFGWDGNGMCAESTKWLVAFIKELQEKLEFEENQTKKPDREQSMVAHFQIDLIKEILGA
jgi:hypothetical protein